MMRTIPLPPTLFSLIFTLLSLRGWADVQKPGPSTPVPKPPAVVQVMRGAEVEIPLTAVTSATTDVLFLIRQGPTAGKILEDQTKRLTKSSVLVRYASDPRSKAKTDSFTFAVRLEGGTVSNAVEVKMSLVDAVASLQVPPLLDFGNVRVGQAATGTLVLKNTGNAAFSRSIPLPEGFAWESGSGKIEIAPGASANLRIIFRPQKAETLRLPVVMAEGQETEFRAECLAPFSVPGSLTLQWNEEKKQRTAGLEIQNPGSAPLTISVQSDSLMHEKELTVGPGERKMLDVGTDGLAEGAAELKLESSGGSVSVKVIFPAVPAIVEMDSKLPNGELVFPPGEGSLSKKIVIANRGGAEATIYGRQPRSFQMDGFASGMTLAPGKSVEFTVSPREDVGAVREEIKLEWGENRLLKFTAVNTAAKAPQVEPSLGPITVLVGDENDPPVTGRLESAAALMKEFSVLTQGALVGSWDIDSKLPALQGAYQKSASSSSVEIAWPKMDGISEYTVFMRTQRMHEGRLIPLWSPVSKIDFKEKDGEVVARLTGLSAGSGFSARIIGKTSQGKACPPSAPQTYLAAQPFDWSGLLFWGAAILVAGGGLFFWNRRRVQHWRPFKGRPKP